MKQKYYRLDRIKKANADYNLLIGERSNGKSYAVKENSLIDAWNDSGMFIYLRRWQLETKANIVESYFADAPITSITNGTCNCVSVYRNECFFSNMDENGTITRVKKCGRVLYLSGAEHYKSMSFPNFNNIIFEEFMTNGGYLYNEVRLLFDIVSTVARRRSIKVWLIGNTISRLCPYFSEWELYNIPKQEQGTIEIYERQTDQIDEHGNPVIVKIAVELCENSGNNSKMFFGNSQKMITNGAWETKPQPHLPKKYIEYTRLYSILVEHSNFAYIAEVLRDNENSNLLLYVYPFTYKSKKPLRVISQNFTSSPFTTPRLTELCTGDIIVNKLIGRGKICFSDNLTGSEFLSILKEKGGL